MDARHRPVVCPAPGRAGLLSSLVRFPQRGRAERWAFHRARGAMCVETHVDTLGVLRLDGTGQPHALGKSTRQWLLVQGSRPQKQENACVPHATVLSACNSQRRHALGVLTECLASPHCWVLGPPTPTADRHSSHDLAGMASRPCSAQKGPQSRRGRRIPLQRRRRNRRASLVGAGRRKDSRKAISEKEEFASLCAACACRQRHPGLHHSRCEAA